jgi:hypothetical protein
LERLESSRVWPFKGGRRSEPEVSSLNIRQL